MREGFRPYLIGTGIFLSLFSFSQGPQISQWLDSARFVQFRDFEKAVSYSDSAKSAIYSTGANANARLLVETYQVKIISSLNFSRIQECRKYLGEASDVLEQYRKSLGENYELLKTDNLISWGEYYFDINDYGKALPIFVQAFDFLNEKLRTEENCINLFSISQYIAAIHEAQGEFEASINQYLTSIPYYECYRDKSKPGNYTLIFRNIGQAYLGKKDYQKAREYFGRAETSLQQNSRVRDFNLYASSMISFYEALASYHNEVGQNDSSWLVFQKAVNLLRFYEPFRGRIYQGLGEANEAISNFSAAMEYYTKAAKFYRGNGNHNISLGISYWSLGKLFEKLNQPDSALIKYQRAIESLVLDFDSFNFNNPELSKVLSKKHLFNVLQRKAVVLEKIFAARQDFKLLRLAKETNQLALSLLDSTANEFSLDRDKVILAEQSYPAFEDGIRLSALLYKMTQSDQDFLECFSLTDKSKGIVLLENLRLVNRFIGINPEWLEAEREIKSEMIASEQAIYELEARGESGELQELRKRFSIVKRDYSALISKIKKEAPEYYRLRFDRQTVTPAIIQSEILKEGEALIEFFAGDSILAVLGFTRHNRFMKLKKMDTGFAARIQHFRELLTNTEDLEPAPELYEMAGELYTYLLKDCLEALGTDINSLTIVPDGVLGYLPFEVLVTGHAMNTFLGDKFAIHYAYSASYLNEQMQQKEIKSKRFFGGFVAAGGAMFRSHSLPPLPGAEREVASIAELVNSRVSLFSPATKSDFISLAPDFEVLHLAMHSVINDANPMLSSLIFSSSNSDSTSGNHLTAIELYGMKLNSSMAVLSACNTGFGKLHRGEGIMSFSRAFAYAGVPSAVISLWQVPDKATSRIMVNFYKHLKNGERKDIALQWAKKEFVSEYPQMAHPFFWSGFILTGNSDPIRFPSSVHWLKLTLAIAGVAIILWLVFRKKLRHSPGSF